MTHSQKVANALIQTVGAISDALREATQNSPTGGMPSGTLYAILMQHGITLEQYTALIDAMVEARRIEKRGDLLVWIWKGE